MSEIPLLDVEGVCTAYGTSQVLFEVSLAAPPRGVIAILGRNGAGKTTLLRTIIGELRPRRGRVAIGGRDVTGWATEKRVRQGVAYVPQEHAVFAGLTVRENLKLGSLLNDDATAIDKVLDIFPKLGERLSQRASTLSGGERKMLAIARALLSEPRLLLLDEPTEGVWVGVIEEIAERLAEMSRSMAIVLVEQHVELALDLAASGYVIDRGRVVLAGAASELRGNPDLYRYLAP